MIRVCVCLCETECICGNGGGVFMCFIKMWLLKFCFLRLVHVLKKEALLEERNGCVLAERLPHKGC